MTASHSRVSKPVQRPARNGDAAAEGRRPADLPREEDIAPVSSDPAVLAWFASRGISEATLERNGVGITRTWSPAAKAAVPCIVFPYRRGGVLVNCKYRATDAKVFWQSRGGDKVLYGLDDIAQDVEQVVIVEGEMDKLAMEEAGFRNCISVPDGAHGCARARRQALRAAAAHAAARARRRARQGARRAHARAGGRQEVQLPVGLPVRRGAVGCPGGSAHALTAARHRAARTWTA